MSSDATTSRKRVYFDANVYADLALGRIPDADKMLTRVRTAVVSQSLVVIPSIEIFEELVLAAKHDEGEYRERWRLIHELVDWPHTLKPANELLKDDFISFANTGHAANPYVTRKLPYYEGVEIMANMTDPPSPMELQQLAQQISDHRDGFARVINQAREDWYGKKEYPADFTFSQYWMESNAPGTDESTSFPKKMVNDLAASLGVDEQCRARGLAELLSIPTILLTIGYWIRSWHVQVTRGRSEKPSVAYDFRHCTLAGAVGTFVTRDADLRKAIEEIPGHDVQVMSLPELIATLEMPA